MDCTLGLFVCPLYAAMFCKDNAGEKIDPVEYCIGGESKARKDSGKVILFGDCAIRNNKYIEAAASVAGCPPKIVDSLIAMINQSLDKKKARKVLATRFIKGTLNKIGIYHENFSRPYAYDPPEFDLAHF